MNKDFKKITWLSKPLRSGFVLFLTTLFIVSCSSGNSSGGGSDDGGDDDVTVDYTELLLINDGATLKTLAVTGSTATEVGSASLAIPGTYERSGNTVTVTMTNHNLSVGQSIELNFAEGTGGTATSGTYLVVTTPDSNVYTVTDASSGSITGGVVTRTPTTTLSGTYTQTDTTITVNIPGHGIPDGSSIALDFTSGDGVDTSNYVSAVTDSDNFTVSVSNSVTTDGGITVTYMENFSQFFAVMHPNGNWIYTTSTYSCFSGSPMCWGNGLISRFAINWSTGALTYEESFYAKVDALSSGDNAPTGLAFSSDGSLLFVHDDDLDGLTMWSVDSAGDITFQAASGSGDAYLHGLSVNAAATHVYNGDNVFTVDTIAPSLIRTTSGSNDGCNSSILSGDHLYCADDHTSDWGVRVYDAVTDPENLVEIDNFQSAEVEVRELALTSNGFVTSGFCGLRSYTFDGATIAPAANDGSNEYVGCDGAFLTSGKREMYRTLSINSAGDTVATAYFTNDPNDGAPPSGFKLISIDSNGSLLLAADYPNSFFSRIAKFIQKP